LDIHQDAQLLHYLQKLLGKEKQEKGVKHTNAAVRESVRAGPTASGRRNKRGKVINTTTKRKRKNVEGNGVCGREQTRKGEKVVVNRAQ
jgi:hypothetical protein